MTGMLSRRGDLWTGVWAMSRRHGWFVACIPAREGGLPGTDLRAHVQYARVAGKGVGHSVRGYMREVECGWADGYTW